MQRFVRPWATLILLNLLIVGQALAADRPNILWITAEDMSPTLGCYGDTYATTPNIDALAGESVRYTNAFASAPVCSPSRSCLINGLYATSQGTQNMRSAFPIPERMIGFPTFLRRAGYYTSNNVKTDYNSGNYKDIEAASWDETSPTAHWKSQKSGDQNFFSVFNLMTSHQSRTMVWPHAKFVEEVQSKLPRNQIHDPAKVPLPPYYPDTPIVRKSLARYYDCVTVMDQEVGDLLQQLKASGKEDNTIVFFYSDHGSGMPRHKRALLDSGLKVALMVRFPEKWKHLAPSAPGTHTDRLVSFADYAPTVLSLTEQPIPDYMEGQPFLGKSAVGPRDHIYGHRDRVDEVIDLGRALHDKRFLYIRNFMPHLGYNQRTAWPDLGEIRHEIYAATDRATMTNPQWHFAGPTRPLEELYDCIADPQNLNNLAGAAPHAQTLRRMRDELFAQIKSTKDLGFLPEALAWDYLREGKAATLYDLARTTGGAYDQQRLVDAASQVGHAPEADLLDSLAHSDPGVRYWAAVGLAAQTTLSDRAATALKAKLSDSTGTVRVEAANALARHGHTEQSLTVLAEALEAKNLSLVQHAARTLELLGDKNRPVLDAVRACDARMKVIRPPGTSPVVVEPDKDMAMFVGFSTEAILNPK